MNILIVESKAKCKTLLKYLGRDSWRVMPTGGHIERLPVDRKLHPPKEVRKAYWSNRPGELPAPPWFWTERGEAAIQAIRDEAAKHDEVTFYLAADPDREGERIAWHLQRLLDDLGPCHRVTFKEITKPAVLAAVADKGEVDQKLVDAALIRTFIDRTVGWRASRIAKRYTTTSTNSMGRVQTPTLGFVVERELEREAHVPVKYFEVHAATDLCDWGVRFHERKDADAWVDEKGKFDAGRTSDEALATGAHASLDAARRVSITDVTRRQKSQGPAAPFSTDTLLQAAGSRWGWSPKKTAALAGQLYEAGHFTYIRTDSNRLAAEAVEAGRALVAEAWGAELLGDLPGSDASAASGKAKPGATAASDAKAPGGEGAGAQDAHEAIRPTNLALEVVADAEPDVQKLYALVRARTLASLMANSVRVTLSLRASCAGLELPLEGSVGWYAEPGWRRAFAVPGLDNASDQTQVAVDVGTELELSTGDAEHPNPLLREDATKPPARYRAHTLVKAMKDAGIGRPSTYSKTVERLEERKYVTIEEGALVPTPSGRNIWLEAAPLFSLEGEREAFQAEYTAQMEALLDDVAAGRSEASEVWEQMLGEFRAAHLAAQEASKTGPLVPRTRAKLEDYLAAAPELAKPGADQPELTGLADLSALSEERGRELLAELRERGISLLPSEAQRGYLERLLEATGLDLEAAIESAQLVLEHKDPERLTRTEASALIDHLDELRTEGQVPSPKQLRWIADMTKKAGLDEAKAAALVELTSFAELTGGKGGSASALIDALKPLAPRKGAAKKGAAKDDVAKG
ncbi:MAG: type IA DNA topoisomerase [Planctomycetota bacterium]|nr:type IA DNA topoisomerase [Planctomycetota bacterium]